MGVLEQVSQMKKQNVPEQEIVSRLKEQRVPPKQINDALNQLQIKEAVYDSQEQAPAPIPIPEEQTSEETYVPKTQEMEQEQYAPQEEYASQPQEEYVPQPQEEYAPPQQVYQQEPYQGYMPETQNTDTIIEISEQVFTEKIKKIEKHIDKLTDTQILLQTQTEHSTERLKRIEAMIDKLQIAILEKIGSYGKNLESIKKEMSMVEDSFSKIIPHARATKKHTAHKKKQTKKSSKKK